MKTTLLIKTTLLMAVSAAAFGCAAQPAQEDADAPASQQAERMQAGMQEMQALMARIRETEDPEERRRLMNEHMLSMQRGMSMMGQMMRGGADDTGPQARDCPQGDADCRMQRMLGRQEMMEQRMGMMHTMMEQMMRRMIEQTPGE